MGNHRRALWLALAGFSVLPGGAWAQERQITGTVTRTGNGQPIAEAVVAVAGTARSARTDAQGKFTIAAPSGEVRLTARAIGFTRKDAIVPAGKTSVNFVLDQDVFKLEEVVVSGEATTVERRNLTTSVGFVSGEDLSKVAAPTIENALFGKLSGVNIQSNGGAPGGGVQLQIRGTNTILGSFDPLYVVDGVIYSNARILGGRNFIDDGADVKEDDAVNRVADLNPADIASIEVLKGAAAAAIYGSKAANGVVVVKTIRGQSGAPRVDVSQRLGTYDLLRKYTDRQYSTIADAVAAFGPSAQTYLDAHGLGYFNHYDQIYGGHRLSYETVADVSGGDANTKYFVSGTVKRDNSTEVATGFDRQSLRVNLDQAIGKKVDVSVSSVFNRNLTDRGWDNNCNNYACFGYALAYIPSFIDLRQQPDGTFLNPGDAGSPAVSNPLQTAALARNQTETNRFTGGTTITYKAQTSDKSSLRFIANGGADLFNQNDNLFAPNALFFEIPRARPGVAIENNGSSRQVNVALSGVHTWRPGGAQFTTSAGVQYEDRRLKVSRITTDNVVPGQENVNQGSHFLVNEEQTPERTLAYYAQEDVLLFGDRLLITGGVRAERSSANGDVGHYYTYPRLSAKYSFRDLFGAGSEFKLRASYGQLGNQPNFGNKFTLLSTPIFGGVNGIADSTTVGTGSIKPERVTEYEGGFDLSFLRGRANIEFTAYRRRTTDLLLARTPAPSTGILSQIFNGGEIENKGLEATLGLTPFQKRDFSWVSNTTFTLQRSKVLNLPVPAFQPPSSGFGGLGILLIEEGKSLTRVYGVKFIDPSDPSKGTEAGDVGDTNPDFRVGFQNNLNYKSLNFSFTIDWQHGGTVTNLSQLLRDDPGGGPQTLDFGTPAYDQRFGYFANYGVITPYIESATFLKLREVALTWLLPKKVGQAFGIGVRDVRLGVTGRDLWWHTNYTGLDPEVANFGASAIRSNVDVMPYPPSRSVFFNIAVSF